MIKKIAKFLLKAVIGIIIVGVATVYALLWMFEKGY